jgi:oligopeptide/dipeptide ABC transporter ATP-binding protein
MSAANASLQPVPADSAADPPLLEIRGLTTAFPRRDDVALAVRDVSLSLRAGEVLGLVGESGSGKSVTLRSILGLVPSPGAIVAGSIRLDGRELVGARESELRRVRGTVVSMISQDPASALNPVFTIGEQIAETVRVHLGLGRAAARAEALRLLERVGIPSPRERLGAYPHELSGGMRQRAMIATAISCRPRLILADEPTTSLDVTIQDQILRLLADLRDEYGAAMILVTHDLGVVAQNADTIAVMYAGNVVELAPTDVLFERPGHPYTRGLIQALPTLAAGGRRQPLMPIPGQPPDIGALPRGCPFQPRCPHVRDACAGVDMRLLEIGPAQLSACPFMSGGDA